VVCEKTGNARRYSARGDPARHCERNEVVAFSREEQRDVAGGNPESVLVAECLLPYSRSWVAASRVALLAMTNAALTLTPFVVIPCLRTGVNAALTLTPFVVSLSNHERAIP
jgi:hypothetical protein